MSATFVLKNNSLIRVLMYVNKFNAIHSPNSIKTTLLSLIEETKVSML